MYFIVIVFFEGTVGKKPPHLSFFIYSLKAKRSTRARAVLSLL
jgi:hypothetical protein